MHRRFAFVALAGVAVAACTDATDPLVESIQASFAQGGSGIGAVYVQSNSAAGNAVMVFPRFSNGSLGTLTSYSTGGTGTGAGLGSQGAVVLTDAGDWLLAVNAGSDDLSVFRVNKGSLTLTDRVASGGDMPISVTSHGDLVYVLNAGSVNNISGFRLSSSGMLSPIAGSTRPLSAASPAPAQIEFSPDGSQLVVTEKGTDLILTYQVEANGTASAPITHTSAGATPFGFAFAGRDVLIVSEAFGGAANASATSSYVLGSGSLSVISPSVATTETAACWTVVTKNRKYAYVTNTGSGTVSGYAIGHDGSLTLLDSDGVTAVTGDGSSPIDAAINANGKFLYVLNAGTHTVSGFRVLSDGSLSSIGTTGGLPAGSVGAAAQ